MKGKEPYEKRPVYKSDHFLLRLVEEVDAKDLLKCYSDLSAIRLMNADNCGNDFHYDTLDEMRDCIRGWIGSYEAGHFVRLSIVDAQDSRAIGTIEMFDKTKSLGILRLDLCSAYERQDYIAKLLGLMTESFYDDFAVRRLLTKAIPAATERVAALRVCGFTLLDAMPRGYDVCWRWADGVQQPVPRDAAARYADYYMR